MSGPVASVLTPILDAELIPPRVPDIFHAISAQVRKPGPSEYELQIIDTQPIGGLYRGAARPFVFEAQQVHREELDISKVHAEFGIEPVQEFVIMAMCNGKEDHRILAEM